jgi:FlaA1/EpsC-like NDP-sugar epimerase
MLPASASAGTPSGPNLGPKLRAHATFALAVVVQLALVAAANELAFLLRFDGDVPLWAAEVQLRMLPWLIVIRGLTFIPFGVYRGVWRYASIWEMRNIAAAILASSVVFLACVTLLLGVGTYPRSVFILDALLAGFLIAGVRLAARLHRGGALQLFRSKPSGQAARRVLIYGAGEAGESIVRDIRHHARSDYEPIGFIDDDERKVGRTVHGVRVFGTRNQLPRLMAEHGPDEVLIAMPTATPSTVRSVVRALETFAVRITILPNLRDILAGTVTVSQIRQLAVEDLLPRMPVGLDEAAPQQLLAGRRVMVTGAGGSIGSELCQQIASLGPESLVLFERTQNSLSAVANALADRGAVGIHPTLGDITDVDLLDRVLAQHRPEVIFHAAAHKHVPMMEAHPCEAVKNNVGGTRVLAEAARRHGVDRFVLVSTDKAVNPTSVMGATKRVAELVVMNEGRTGDTTFMTVRFGNVLGSNGSAIPRFLDQIKRGGPVTITHPDMRRYFMLLPEAVHLVLQVAGRGSNQGVYVLDMGEQIKVEEMARNVIRLSGYVPDEEIAISYIGLRPGEKMFEELVGSGETVQASPIPRVHEVRPDTLPSTEWLAGQVRRLESLAKQGHASGTVRALRVIVPEYTGCRPESPATGSTTASSPEVLAVRTAGAVT